MTELLNTITPRLTDEEVIEQAALWTVELSANEPVCKKALLLEFKQWQQIDSRHLKAAQQMQGFIDAVNSVSSSNANHAVTTKSNLLPSVINNVLANSRSSMLASTLKGAALSLLLTLFVLGGGKSISADCHDG